MMQFINTLTGVRTNSACELVQTATTKKNAVWPARLSGTCLKGYLSVKTT